MSRLIDADVFKKNMDYVCTMGGWLEPISSAITEYVKKHIDAQTTVDAVEVVRCKDCKYFRFNECEMWGEPAEGNNPTSEDGNDYCSWGERKDHE